MKNVKFLIFIFTVLSVVVSGAKQDVIRDVVDEPNVKGDKNANPSNFNGLRDQLYETSSAVELFSIWRAAKHNLAISGVLNLEKSLLQVLRLTPNVNSDDEERQLFREKPVEWLRETIYNVLAKHHYFSHIMNPLHSTSQWRGWSTQGNFISVSASTSELEKLCQELSSEATRTSQKYLRAAELILFHSAQTSAACQHEQPKALLKKAVDTNSESSSVADASVLLAALVLSDEELEGHGIIGEASKNVLESITQVAHKTNHPVGHMILARSFGEKDPIKRKSRDCDRAASHLIQANEATFLSVTNYMTGALDRRSRISTVNPNYDTFEALNGPASTGDMRYRTKEEFYDQEMHLRELVKNEFDNDALAVQLGDFYYFGAPELGIEPRMELAKEMYTRAIESNNAVAASHLATMLVNEETTIGSKNNNETAFDLYSKAAEWGDPLGWVGLGIFYQDDSAPQVEKVDLHMALKYFNLAAANGVSEGAYRAARINLYYPEMNSTEGLIQLERAAEAGHVYAAYELGLILFEEDLQQGACERAVKWLAKAARADWTNQLPFDSSQGLQAFIEGDREEDALNIYLVAHVALWQQNAGMNAAYLLELGHIPSMDIVVTWADLTLSEPTSILTYMLEVFTFGEVRGRVPSYLSKETMGKTRTNWAKKLYEYAADNFEDGEALRKLGDCFWDGWNGICGQQPSKEKAVWYYRRAADAGDGQAAWILGNLRRKGDGGLQRNLTKAREEYDRAIQQDPSAWLIIELSRLTLLVEQWFTGAS